MTPIPPRRSCSLSIRLILASCFLFAALASPQLHAQTAQPDQAAQQKQPAQPAHVPPSGITFTDVTAAAGITFRQQSSPEKRYIVESMAGGVALLDYNNDGWLDIFLVNSCTTANADDPKCSKSALYRNEKNGKFTDVAEDAGIAYVGWGMGVCTADVDANGFPDVYVTTLGSNKLFLNQDGKFTEVGQKAGVTAGNWSTGCGFADYDNDGDLDLFVSRYVNIDLKNLPEFGKGKTCQYRGIAVQCGPRGLPGLGDLLYRNNGDGTFAEVGAAAGAHDPNGYFGLGILWWDYDEDGLLDLFVTNDSNPNLFYRNLGGGKFKEVGFPTGLAVSEDGSEQGCMGVALADYNSDGRQDLFITNFAEEYNILYKQDADRNFLDASFASRTASSSLPYVGWGTAFFDYDNDGWPDLLAVNGHVYPQLESANLGASAPYKQRKLLYHNEGNGTFTEVAAKHGAPLMERRVSRGAAFGDLDNDGDVDVVINDLDSTPMVLRNDGGSTGPNRNWLIVKLKGRGKNVDAIGAQVKVTLKTGPGSVAKPHIQLQTVRSGTSYISQDDMRLHFGLGSATSADQIEIRWPSGKTSRHEAVKGGQVVTLTEPQ